MSLKGSERSLGGSGRLVEGSRRILGTPKRPLMVPKKLQLHHIKWSIIDTRSLQLHQDHLTARTWPTFTQSKWPSFVLVIFFISELGHLFQTVPKPI